MAAKGKTATKSVERKEPQGLDALILSLEKKLKMTRAMIGEYEEAMDYATHCNLMGFAEGLDFALEEVLKAAKKKRKAPETND